ncbi:MAG: hypothetical protein PHS51_01555 [Gallionella sp.]|nr:hypothetical protein [Gallionella sp.]
MTRPLRLELAGALYHVTGMDTRISIFLMQKLRECDNERPAHFAAKQRNARPQAGARTNVKGNIQSLGAVQRHAHIEGSDADRLALDDRPVQPEIALL